MMYVMITYHHIFFITRGLISCWLSPMEMRRKCLKMLEKSAGEDDVKNLRKMLDMFEDNDDVQNVWHNWEEDE